MTPIYLGCLSTLTLLIPSNSLGTWGVLPSPARWCLGIQGLGRRLNSALHPVLVLVSANSRLFLLPDSSKWSADVSFILLPLLGGQPSLPRGLERQLGRESLIHHKHQQLMLSKCIWHCWGGSVTSLGQHLVFAAFLLLIPALVPSWMGFPSFTSSAAVADWLWIL